MRLIDVDALIETMRENAEGNEGWYGDTWAFMRDVENAPTIDAEPQWIPCDERLPESEERLPKKDGSYLVCVEWASGKKAVGDCEYTVDYGFRTVWNCTVLAWMPLPKPYEGERSK